MIAKIFGVNLLGLMLVLGSIQAFGASDLKIGYVDMQRAIQATKVGQLAKSTLEKEFNKKKKALAKLEGDLKKMNEDLEKKSLVLSDEIRQKKQQNLQREMLKYRELVGRSQMDIQKRERELTVPIIKNIRKVIGDIAEKEAYTVVLEKSEQSVLWAKKEIDLTDRIVKIYNSKYKK